MNHTHHIDLGSHSTRLYGISRVSGPHLSRRREKALSLAALTARFRSKPTKSQLGSKQAQNKPRTSPNQALSIQLGKQSPVAAQSCRGPNGPKTGPNQTGLICRHRCTPYNVCTCESSLYSCQVTVLVWRNSSYPEIPPKRPKPLLFHPP